MKEKDKFISSNNKKDKIQKNMDWFQYLLSPVIVGCVVLLGQSFIAPHVAKKVKIEESILHQRYKACETAVNILQRRLAYAKMEGDNIPEWYEPPEKKPPTQVEVNTAYTMLAIYGKSGKLAEHFFAVSGTIPTDPKYIVEFVSSVRKELGIDKKGYSRNTMHYIINRPVNENGQMDN